MFQYRLHLTLVSAALVPTIALVIVFLLGVLHRKGHLRGNTPDCEAYLGPWLYEVYLAEVSFDSELYM